MRPGGDRIPLFLNRGSGSAPADPEAFAASIDERLVPQVLAPLDIARAAADAARDGIPLVAVAGGDGTIRTAAEALIGTTTALLPMPSGTFNHFARRLGLEDLDACTSALRDGTITTVPAGAFTERSSRRGREPGSTRYFLNTLTFGEYANVLKVRAQLRPYVFKWPAAIAGFVVAMVRARQIDVGLEVDGAAITRRTPLLWLGMGRGTFPRVVEAAERRRELDLELAVLRTSSFLPAAALILRVGARLMRRQLPIEDAGVELLHTRALTVHAHHRIDSTADGEILRLNPPVEIEVRDSALHVLVPPQSDPVRPLTTG